MEKGKKDKSYRGVIVFALVMALIIILITYFLESKKISYQQQIDQQSKIYFTQLAKKRVIEKTKKMRIQFFQKVYVLDLPYRYTYIVADFVRQLSLFSSPKLRLIELEITWHANSFSFSLAGSIIEIDKVKIHNMLDDFVSRIKELEGLEGVNISQEPNKSSDSMEKPGVKKPLSKKPEKSAECFFYLKGEMGLE